MPFLIGIDEAGYGPNLGPLVVAATVWRVFGLMPDDRQLDARVAQVISRKAPRARRTIVRANAATNATVRPTAARRVCIADSKAIYNPHVGLALLELNVLAMSVAAGAMPADCRALWQWIAPQAVPHRDSEVWNREFNPQLPLEADAEHIARLGKRVAAGLDSAGLQFLGARASVLFPAQFNQSVAEAGSKGTALSRASVALVAECLTQCADGEAVRVCGDKHGGRHYYGPLLQQQFPEWLVEIRDEGVARSLYRFGPPDRRVEVSFRVRGERALPTALASMFAKYLRELSMRAFNEFWCARVPRLRPTAGYPSDARRFKQAIAGAQAALGIDDAVLWRAR